MRVLLCVVERLDEFGVPGLLGDELGDDPKLLGRVVSFHDNPALWRLYTVPQSDTDGRIRDFRRVLQRRVGVGRTPGYLTKRVDIGVDPAVFNEVLEPVLAVR